MRPERRRTIMTETQDLGVDYDASSTKDLADVAQELFGEEWAAPLAQMTGVSLRTCQRLRAAARTETDHPSARGVVAELRGRLSALALRADPRAFWLADAFDHSRWRDRREAIYEFADVMAREGRSFVGPLLPSDAPVGPVRAEDWISLTTMANEFETGVAKATTWAVEALNSQDSADLRRELQKIVALGSMLMDSRVEVEKDGHLSWLKVGPPVFSDEAYSPPSETNEWDGFLVVGDEMEPGRLVEIVKSAGYLARPARLVGLGDELNHEGLLVGRAEDLVEASDAVRDAKVAIERAGGSVRAIDLYE
jgi:hypothetical protein